MENTKVIEKLQAEIIDLEDKMTKLERALTRPDISDRQKDLMQKQFKAMVAYHTALVYRVDDLTGNYDTVLRQGD